MLSGCMVAGCGGPTLIRLKNSESAAVTSHQ